MLSRVCRRFEGLSGVTMGMLSDLVGERCDAER